MDLILFGMNGLFFFKFGTVAGTIYWIAFFILAALRIERIIREVRKEKEK